MHVQELMTHPVATCRVDSTLNEAAQRMWECDCGAVPVVDDEGRLAGMITDRDICMAAYTRGDLLRTIPVATAMAPQVLACHIDDSIETAEQLMREGQVRRLPVIDNDGRPAGIVSMNDLARLAAAARKSNMDRTLIETLAVICEPRAQVARPEVMRSV